jgi:hypothetical protein
MPRRALLAAVVIALAAGPGLAGCASDEPAREAVFQVQSGLRPDAAGRSCQLHQTDRPTSAYRGGQASEPTLELPFLAYFTANGNKPYCDGRPPSGTDRQWAQLYVQLTGNGAAVRQILAD